MYARVLTASLFGLSCEKTWAEVDCENGLPGFSVVGLANQAIKESRERIKSAIINCDYEFPTSKITVNLTPANIKKDGSHFDLPIALALLISADIAKVKDYDNSLAKGNIACIGELSLDGKVNPVDGALSMIIGLQKEGVTRIIIPKGNFSEARLVKGMLLYPVETLKDAIDHITGYVPIKPFEADGLDESSSGALIPDFSDIKGQEMVKRAAQVAAAGMHGMLMLGPPGVGKSMVGKRIPGIMPPLSYKEKLEVTQIYSVAGLLSEKRPMISERPFRSPHHSISGISLVGGGTYPSPGEISLAHNGVLFLDEFPEFKMQTLDMLRQPLEDGEVSIVRINGKVTYPSRFMLVAAMNPCRCGYYGDPVKPCTCTATERERYIGKISGPLLDRIDIHVVMERIIYEDIATHKNIKTTDTKTLREKVMVANKIQEERYKKLSIDYNSQLTPKLIEKFCGLDNNSKSLMEAAFSRWNMSARQYHRILKVSRTIADLDESENIKEGHLLEALNYRIPEKYFR
mgnify:CR=1 FL=1